MEEKQTGSWGQKGEEAEMGAGAGEQETESKQTQQ